MNKLFDMEFDEVSSVDRPANQHGIIAISKSATAEELSVPEIFTEAGEQVLTDELAHGDVVYDGDGNEYVYVEDELEFEDDDEDEDVEKGIFDGAIKAGRGLKTSFKAGRRGKNIGEMGVTNKLALGANFVGRNPGLAAGVAAGGAGVAGGGAYMIGRKDSNMEKSLGDSVLEQLSKAVSEADREEIIAKALDEVEIAKAQAEAAREELAWMQDQRMTEAFIAKAADYNLPVSPELFGPILKAAATVLDDEQLEILDHVLEAVGESNIYDEIGYAGGAANSIFDQVNGFAAELVEKSAGDFSLEQASVAMFASNPDAYDAYIAEQNGR